MGSQNNRPQKEDHLAPTKIEGQQKKEQVPFDKNLSDHELRQRLDLYSKGDANQFFKIQRIKQDYINKTSKDQNTRSISDLYYGEGRKVGLPQTDYRNIADDREELDQKYRDHIAREGKTEYRKHITLGRLFGEQNKKGEISKREDTQKEQIYKNLSSIMAEYNEMQYSRDKAMDNLKSLRIDPSVSPPANDVIPNQRNIDKGAKSLSQHFQAHWPSAKEVRKDFEKMKNKDKEREQ